MKTLAEEPISAGELQIAIKVLEQNARICSVIYTTEHDETRQASLLRERDTLRRVSEYLHEQVRKF